MAAQTFTEEQISLALNRACDDIIKATDAGDEGLRDALNLLVNAGMSYLREPEMSLEDVVEANYAREQDGAGPLEWIARGL